MIYTTFGGKKEVDFGPNRRRLCLPNESKRGMS